MAVSGAIHPQLLSVVGSDAHYGGLLPALTAAVSWWAAGAGSMFDRCSPSELANSGCRGEAFVWEVPVNVGRGCSGLLAVLHPAIVFSLSITTQPIHLPLLPPCFSACRSSTERIEMWRRRRRRSRKWRESRELNESHMNRRRGWLIKGIAQHYKKRAYICLLEMRRLFG